MMLWCACVAVVSFLVDAGGAAPVAPGTVSGVAARARGAVVSVSTRPLMPEDFGEKAPARGLGSGVIVDPNGIIVTNHHVIAGGERIKVTLVDDRTFQATLVGSDPHSDLALLRISATRLPSMRLGDSSKLTVGEPVVAIGNAMWIEGGPSVTAGIVSALNRSMEQPGLPLLHHLIQTDAAINPGNSGGPLLNLRGQVVGINTALIPSAHGIGFAIAINEAKSVISQLLATGRVVRPWLGFEGVSVTASIASANDLPVDRGVFVVRVSIGGPAARAGLREGDVVMRLAGTAVKNLHQFEDVLARQPIGTNVSLGVRRHAQVIEAAVMVVERPGRVGAGTQ